MGQSARKKIISRQKQLDSSINNISSNLVTISQFRKVLDRLNNSKLNLSLVIIGIITAVIYYRQSIAADIQAAAAIEQVKIAREQLDISKDQINKTKQEIILNDAQTVSSKQQSNDFTVRVLEIQRQPNLNQNQYDTSISNLNLAIGNTEADAFIIPIEKQIDSFAISGHTEKYRVIIRLDMLNLSSMPMPIAITNMVITFIENNVSFNKTLAHVNNFALTNHSSVNIENEYPDVFTLQQSDTMRKYAVFATDYYPSSDVVLARLVINTSKNNTISHTFNIYKMPGLAVDLNASPIRFNMDRNSIDKENKISFFP